MPRKPPRTEASDLAVRLGEAVPDRLPVGGGAAVVIEGVAAAPGCHVADLRVRVGGGEVRANRGLPRPGELAGADWWTAVVPIAAVEKPRRAPIELHARVDGVEVARELGAIDLEPGPERVAEPAATATEPSRLVAICLATHQPPLGLLRRQIESIRAQTHRDWVCFVTDDASSREYRSEIQRLLDADPRFRFASADERVGFYLNFERALRSVPAEAAYVALADQDDRWDEDKLATLIAALDDEDVLAYSDARVVGVDGRRISPTAWPRGRPRTDRLGSMLLASPVIGASCLFRRRVLDQVLPFPPPVGTSYHDRWIAVVSRVLGGIAYVDRPLFDYVQHRGSVLGHAGTAEPGRLSGESRRHAIRRRYAGLRRTGFHPNWRAHHYVLLRCVQEAEVLRLRLGDRMSPPDRRDVDRIRDLPHSGTGQARLLLRHLAHLPRRRPGREAAVARAIAWGHLVRLRSRLARRPAVPGRGASSASPGATRIGITVTRDSAQAGFGDFQVARELGAELHRLGFEVSTLETHRGRWRRRVGSVDVLISLLDAFPLDQVPAGVLTVAWVRNWTERWLERPWFGEYDLVFASSERSRRLIEERGERTAALMPLATNPARFRRTPPDPELRADLVFAGSRWGVSREIEAAMPVLARELDVKLFGRGWDAVPGMNGINAGWLEYERLPAAYSSARVVVDDSAGHARPYEAVNSRVFDALACGTLVVSNDAPGVRALFDDEFPVWEDASTLRAQVDRARDDPDWASGLAERYSAEIIARHTYRHRAELLRDAVTERQSLRTNIASNAAGSAA